jgi:hypothetical protein
VTTIVYKDGVMAGDTAIFDRGTYCGSTAKVFRRKDGALIGIAGRLGELIAYKDWFLNGEHGDRPKFADDESEALIVRPDGTMWWVGQSDICQITAAYACIGTGFKLAVGALEAGATVEEAMWIAMRLDSMTREPMNVVKLHPSVVAAA